MMHKLTDMQRDFVKYMADGVRQSRAAELAGFKNPAVEAVRLMRSEKIRRELLARRCQMIEGEMAATALVTMQELMTNGPAQQRYQASRYILDLAGHKAAQPDSADDTPLEQMTPEQLAQAVQSGTQALAEIARSLDGQHVVDGERRQVRDVQAIEHDAEDYSDILD